MKKLRGLSDIRRHFYRNDAPTYFVGATPFNLLGMDEWCKNFKFINYILDAKNHAWAAENILYKVPNQPAMEGLAPEMLTQFPNMAMTPADLTKFEQLRDVIMCGKLAGIQAHGVIEQRVDQA